MARFLMDRTQEMVSAVPLLEEGVADENKNRDKKKNRRLDAMTVSVIFLCRPFRLTNGMYAPSTVQSRRLADAFGVCDKTIRDIWNRKNWRDVTKKFLSPAELVACKMSNATTTVAPLGEEVAVGIIAACVRPPGRPRGQKNTVGNRTF